MKNFIDGMRIFTIVNFLVCDNILLNRPDEISGQRKIFGYSRQSPYDAVLNKGGEAQMKKLLTIFALFAVVAGCVVAQQKRPEMLPVFSQSSGQQNKIWVGTFQLVWNEFSDNIVKGPVKFKMFESDLADELNKQEFKKSMLSENSYYTAYGVTSLNLKEEIEKALMEKFGETSELLNRVNWSDKSNAYLVYAMLKKDFKFGAKFDALKDKEKFNYSKEKYKYFGIDKESPSYMYNAVKVLFYNSPFDYAVALQGQNDEVILYRTEKNTSFKNIYASMIERSKKYKGSKDFVAGDRLKVPYMSVKQEVSYPQLCGKEILNTDRLYIAQALQNVDFNMNNAGVRLKSEALMDIKTMSMPIPNDNWGRNFFFNKTFYLFMKEKSKPLPYYAMRVQDLSLYRYSGE